MKKLQKSVLSLLLLILLSFSLVSCIDGDVARGTIADFLQAVENDDLAAAATYLHPERPADLSAYFAKIESEQGVDFSAGIEILRYTNVHTSHYDSSVGGSAYKTSFTAKIGDRDAVIMIELVDNDKGYGIYNLDMDIGD